MYANVDREKKKQSGQMTINLVENLDVQKN